ncbi:hypothetical protein [Aestuariibaculum suncheonense]|uniref:Lipoprotein n=1 Tax=Aestuariibaculum suncheonense TaxID=1028745 RepID=A0A8J6QA41_9FLAO|nr:hypothetical protein [Aestuariibaculum suncheonense]MBD0834005.1 hypothetical protein [Aestuariibaculum suncheonense]
MKKIIILIITCTFLTGCSRNLFNFTLVSTQNIELEKLASLQTSPEKITGEDKASIIIFIPTKTIRIDRAISNTIDAFPGCMALMNGTVYSKFWFIPYIYGEAKFVVEGTPVIDSSIMQTTSNLPKYAKVILDKKGNINSIESISEKKYLDEKNKIQNF